jgi:hypothetical protein
MTIRRLVIALFSTFPGPKDVIIARQELTQKHNEEIHELERQLDKNVRIFSAIFNKLLQRHDFLNIFL